MDRNGIIPASCRGRLEGNPAELGLVATLSSIISVWKICVLCGQLAWNMIKSGRKNETPWGGVAKDSLSLALPFLMSRSLPPRSSLHSHPPASSLPLSFSSVPSSFPVCSVNPQATGQSTVPAERRRRRVGVVGDAGTSSSQWRWLKELQKWADRQESRQ